jgi:type II secretory pathway pseudopilin PulG
LDDDGFIMVALLVSIAVAAIWMAAALPSWRQQAIREREAELIFRGESYARAIYLYRQKNGQRLPLDMDVLVSQHFLRRKYLDPITGKEFLAVGGVGLTPGIGGQGLGGTPGLIGVRSTSNDTSIRIYNNQQTYSQWAFDFTLEQVRAGGGVPGLGVNAPGGRPSGPGGRGGRGDELGPIQPGGRGRSGAPGGISQPRGRGGLPSGPGQPPTPQGVGGRPGGR